MTLHKTKIHLEKDIRIHHCLSRKSAEKLLGLVKTNPVGLEPVIEQIEAGLRPKYSYKIRCAGCGRLTEFIFPTEMTKADLKKKDYLLCGPCFDSEDFK